LHDTLIEWLWAERVPKLWLTTDQGTRAQRFYEAAGWSRLEATGRELRFELRNPMLA
jgi:hypothetical protein